MALSLELPEATLDSIAELLPGMMYWLWMDVRGALRFVYVSKNAENWFAVDREALKVDGTPLMALIHPDHYDWVLAESIAAAETESLWCAEFRMLLPDGSLMWLEARDRPRRLEDGGTLWTGYANKITERKRIEEQLRSSETRFRAIVENASDLIFTLNQEGCFVYVSPAWQEVTGVDSGQLGGESITAWLHGDDIQPFQAAVDRVFNLDASRQQGEFRFRSGRGDYRWHSVKISPLMAGDGAIRQCLGLARDIEDSKQMVAQIEHLASYDQLTDLPARSLFFRLLNQGLSDARRRNKRLALLFIDIDGFKSINDKWGHACGDWLLTGIAARLSGCLRGSDNPGRLGGDEFVVAVPGLPVGDDARESIRALADRIRRLVAEPFFYEGAELIISCSLGIAFYPEDGRDELQLMKSADAAMYRAKANGRNQICFFDSGD